jgi:hypothetical protein
MKFGDKVINLLPVLSEDDIGKCNGVITKDYGYIFYQAFVYDVDWTLPSGAHKEERCLNSFYLAHDLN